MTNSENHEMFNQLRASSRQALQEFTASTSKSSTFQIIRSIPDQNHQQQQQETDRRCKTLYVLDSSFNPPSKAHAIIAANAVTRDKGPQPSRLLLLLATTNADKAPKPAAFEDRISMMILMAQSLHESLDKLPVDVGVTKEPFFADKAKSIDDSEIYGTAEQVHLTGYDTLTRIFNSKYYPSDVKLGALDPFLSKHRLRVNYRLGDEFGSKRDQDGYVAGIADGSRKDEGMKSEWRARVDMVDDANSGEGVSSTKARDAVKHGHLDHLTRFVEEGIADYIRGMKLYLDEDV